MTSDLGLQACLRICENGRRRSGVGRRRPDYTSTFEKLLDSLSKYHLSVDLSTPLKWTVVGLGQGKDEGGKEEEGERRMIKRGGGGRGERSEENWLPPFPFPPSVSLENQVEFEEQMRKRECISKHIYYGLIILFHKITYKKNSITGTQVCVVRRLVP